MSHSTALIPLRTTLVARQHLQNWENWCQPTMSPAAPGTHEKGSGSGYAGGSRPRRRGRFNCGAVSPPVSLVPDIAAYPNLLPPTLGSTQSRLLTCSMSSPVASAGELPWISS